MLNGAAAALALTAGALAAFNPCGFALLPAYLAVIVTGAADGRIGREAALRRAVAFGSAMTLGFVVLFGVFGAILSPFRSSILPYLGYVTVVMGIVLVALGVFLARGRELALPSLTLSGSAPRRTFLSQVAYGVSFALASLSCTVGGFLAVVTTSLHSNGVGGLVTTFVLYALGMGGVVIVLSLIAAAAGSAVVKRIHRVTPVLTRVGGWLVLLAGLYVLYYGVYELRVLFHAAGTDPVISGAADIQRWIVGRLDAIPTAGLAALAALALVSIIVFAVRARRRATQQASGD